MKKSIKEQQKTPTRHIATKTEPTDCKIVRFDWAIKNLLRNKANFDILEGFLSELLEQQIKIESLLESESNQEAAKDKFNRVDVLVKTNKNEKILIEVQAATEWDYYHRMLFGTSKLVTEYIDKGQPYHKISKVISVNILFFNLGIGKDYIYKGSTEFRGIHTGTLLRFTKSSRELYLDLKKDYDSPTDIFPTYYVIQLKKFSNIITDKFDQWVYLLKNEIIKPEFDAQGVLSAKEKLDILKLSDKERRKYDADMDEKSFEASLVDSHLIDMKIAKRESREEGKIEGKLEGIALAIRNMFASNIHENEIAKILKISIDEVKAVLK